MNGLILLFFIGGIMTRDIITASVATTRHRTPAPVTSPVAHGAVPQQAVGYARPAGVAPPTAGDADNKSNSLGFDARTRILRLPEVKARVGLCRASIYQQMATGHFPQSVSIGTRAVGWLEYEIDAWLANKIAARGCYTERGRL